MRTFLRWAVALIAALHGAIHLVGDGPVWWAAAVLVIAAALAMATQVPRWWLAIGAAALGSQALIFSAWSEAWTGTVANALLLLAAGYGYASEGRHSFRAEYRRQVTEALAGPGPDSVVTEADLTALPPPVAAYVRRSGALGQPRVGSFRARIRGRIRQNVGKPWMRFTTEQVNTYGHEPRRLFLMDATLFGLPVDVLHTFVGAEATMRAKVCSVLPVLEARGTDMARAETVTLLNDLCVFAPAALVDAPISWRSVDDRRTRATFCHGAHTVTAELVFNEHAELVDFVSDDRLAASGGVFVSQRWSTPLRDYRTVGRYRIATSGEGRWHPEDAPPFTYVELHIDDVAYNVGALSHARPLENLQR